MSLFKLAFWLSVIVLLLPSDQRKQAELLAKAQGAVQWTITFCDRNGETCARGGELWQTFKAKAEFGLKLAGEAIQRGLASDNVQPAVMPPADVRPQPQVEPAVERGTLSSRDREPQWRGQPGQQPSRPRI